jgi:cell division protein FtsL
MRRALLYTSFPACLLVLYVALWTGAMRSGYHKQQISDRIAQLRIENDTLQAEMRRLQWPHRIYQAATQLGMLRAEQIDFVHVTK